MLPTAWQPHSLCYQLRHNLTTYATNCLTSSQLMLPTAWQPHSLCYQLRHNLTTYATNCVTTSQLVLPTAWQANSLCYQLRHHLTAYAILIELRTSENIEHGWRGWTVWMRPLNESIAAFMVSARGFFFTHSKYLQYTNSVTTSQLMLPTAWQPNSLCYQLRHNLTACATNCVTT